MQVSWPLLESLLTDVGAVESLVDLRAVLDAAVPHLGFDHYALVHHVDLAGLPRGAVHLDNYPRGWQREFIQQRYFAEDPVHVACQRAAHPFLWRDLDRMLALNPVQARILGAAREAGLADGLTVPVHVPGDFSGSCSFAVRGREVPEELGPSAQFFGCYAFEAARRIAQRRRGLAPDRPALTPRQLDCVVLVARGKTDTESGMLLGISRETAQEHVEAAKEKLRVATRPQLVARALFGGLITYGDIL